MLQAATEGVKRQLRGLYYHRKHPGPAKRDTPFEDHVRGAMGECAFSRHMDPEKPWEPTDFREPDYYPNWEIRTRACYSWDLFVRDTDANDRRVVLVTGGHGDEMREFVIHGFFWAHAAKLIPAESRWNGPECHWLEQDMLLGVVRP
jgi:hypothetical protein